MNLRPLVRRRRSLTRRRFAVGAAVGLWTIAAGGLGTGIGQEPFGAVGEPAEEYLLAVFASQATIKAPHTTHNWGVAIRLASSPGGPQIVAADAISWMPQTMRINASRLRVEPGWNLTHEQTLEFAATSRQRITLWGIVRLTPDAYAAFVSQKAALDAGRYGYQCLDTVGEAGLKRNGYNCNHALSDFLGLLPHVPTAWQPYGNESAAQIVAALHHRGFAEVDRGTAEQLLSSFGGEQFTIRRRAPHF